MNTVATDLNMKYGAVSASLFNAVTDGSELQSELKKKNNLKNTAKFGELFETMSYGLNCKNIFHGALQAWKGKEQSSRKVNFKVKICCNACCRIPPPSPSDEQYVTFGIGDKKIAGW